MSNLKFQNWSCEKSKQTQLFYNYEKKKKAQKSKAEESDGKEQEQWTAIPELRDLETQPIRVLYIFPWCST